MPNIIVGRMSCEHNDCLTHARHPCRRQKLRGSFRERHVQQHFPHYKARCDHGSLKFLIYLYTLEFHNAVVQIHGEAPR
jgi:hypothetical protein